MSRDVFKVRLSVSERAELEEKAAAAGMNASELLRALLSKSVVINRSVTSQRVV